MSKNITIGYPMEYEDDKHITRTGLWLKEYEVELLEKQLDELKQLKKQKEDVIEFINKRKAEDGWLEVNSDRILRMLGEIE